MHPPDRLSSSLGHTFMEAISNLIFGRGSVPLSVLVRSSVTEGLSETKGDDKW